jgi:outer membrane protein assembly factor BamB/tetratricopeptide (TPR) repeat protein
MRNLCLLIACLFTAAASAAELAWSADAGGTTSPPGWEFHKSQDSKGDISFSAGELTLKSEAASYCHLARDVGVDGSDAAPLIVNCSIAIGDSSMAANGLLNGVALYWDAKHAVAVGLGAGDAPRYFNQGPGNHGWCYVVSGDRFDQVRLKQKLYHGPTWSHYRIVVASRVICVFASRDGVDYELLSEVERAPGKFQGPPARVVVGRGWIDQKGASGADLDYGMGDPAKKDLIPFRFHGLSISNDSPQVSPRMPAGYKKLATWNDSASAMAEALAVVDWRLLGPFLWEDQAYRPEQPVDLAKTYVFSDGAQGTWKELKREDAADIRDLDLQHLMPKSGEDHALFAAAVIRAETARDEQFFYDCSKAGELYLNGHYVAHTPPYGWFDIRRNPQIASLKAGDNLVVIKVRNHGLWTKFNFRREPLGRIHRIHLLSQLSKDFPEEVEEVAAAQREIPGLWEGMGQFGKAVEVWTDVSKRADAPVSMIERAYRARARLHRLLRDFDATRVAIEELVAHRQQHKAAETEAYPDDLFVARQWEDSGYLDKALGVFDELSTKRELGPERLIDVALERARLLRGLKQEAKIAAAFRELDQALGERHPLHVECQLLALKYGTAAEGRDAAIAQAVAVWEKSKAASPAQLAGTRDWLETGDGKKAADDPAVMYKLREERFAGLMQAGELADAEVMLGLMVLADAGRETRARICVLRGRLLRAAGYPDLALPLYRQALEIGLAKDGERQDASESIDAMRALIDPASEIIFPDASNALQAAGRIAETGSKETAIKAYQAAIEEYGNDHYRIDRTKVVGVAEYCADRIAGMGVEGVEIYRRLFDARAEVLFKIAVQEGDAKRFGKVVRTYPYSSVADDALGWLANRSLDRNDPGRAAALIAEIVERHPDSDLGRPLLLAQQAHAYALAGDRTHAEAALDALGRETGEITIGGAKTNIADYVAAQRKDLPVAQAISAPVPVGRDFAVPFPQTIEEAVADLPFRPSWHHRVGASGTIEGNRLFLHTADEACAVDLGTGKLAWRSGPSSRVHHADGFSALIDTTTPVWKGTAFCRALRRTASGERYVIEARRCDSGVLLWSTETNAVLSQYSAGSSPSVANGHVFAVVHDKDDGHLRRAIALDAATGDVVWQTVLISGKSAISLTNQSERWLGDNLPAPTVAGADLYVSTDAGHVTAIDADSGAVRWSACYQHGFFENANGRASIRLLAGRASSRVMAGDALIYVLPRDSMSLVCIRRSNGDIVWQRRMNTYSALISFAPGGRLLAQGRGVDCLDAANGETIWRWQPQVDFLYGQGAICGETIYASSNAGLHRLSLKDGSQLAVAPWASLGTKPIANLILRADRIIGFNQGRVVALKTQTVEGAVTTAAPDPARLVRQPRFASVNLPSGDFADGLAFRWHLGESGGRDIVRAQGSPDDLYLVFRDQVTKFNAAENKPKWTIDIAPDARRILATSSALVVVHHRSMRCYDPQNGRELWSHLNVIDDSGFGGDWIDGQGRESSYDQYLDQVTLTERFVCNWRRSDNHVQILDPKTGKEVARHEYPYISALRVRGDDLWAVVREKGRWSVESRNALGGASQWRMDLSPNVKDFHSQYNPDMHWCRLVLSEDGKRVFVVSESFLVGVDVAAKRELFVEYAQRGKHYDFLDAWMDHGRLTVVWTNFTEGWWQQILNAETGKELWKGRIAHHGWMAHQNPYLGLDEERFLSLNDIDCPANTHGWAIMRSLTKGELWKSPCSYTAVRSRAVLTDRYLITFGRDWWVPNLWPDKLKIAVIDLATGKTAAEGWVPGGMQHLAEIKVAGTSTGYASLFPAVVVRGQVIYGTQQGFYSVSGTPGAQNGKEAEIAALAKKMRDDKQPDDPAQRAGIHEFVTLYAKDAYKPKRADKPMVIDGHLDDWAGHDVIAVDQEHQVKPLATGQKWKGAQDCSAKIRCSFDDRNLYFAAEVADDDCGQPAPGASPRDGDSLLLVLDSRGLGITHNVTADMTVLELALVDGRSRVVQTRGKPVDGDEGKAALRVVRSERGWVYECSIPWAAVRDAKHRPGEQGTMGLGFGVIDWDAGQPHVEMSWGGGTAGAAQALMLNSLKFR